MRSADLPPKPGSDVPVWAQFVCGLTFGTLMAAAYAAIIRYQFPLTVAHWVIIFLFIWILVFLIMSNRLITLGVTWGISYAIGTSLANVLA